MTLRPEYALGHSRFNAFLFAIIGEERTGQPLTVLSAMARLGLNPWEEAARLSALSKDAASGALAALLGKLPEDDWQQSGLQSVAGRLVGHLPDRTTKSEADGSDGTGRGTPQVNVQKLVFWACFAAAITVAVIGQFSW